MDSTAGAEGAAATVLPADFPLVEPRKNMAPPAAAAAATAAHAAIKIQISLPGVVPACQDSLPQKLPSVEPNASRVRASQRR